MKRNDIFIMGGVFSIAGVASMCLSDLITGRKYENFLYLLVILSSMAGGASVWHAIIPIKHKMSVWKGAFAGAMSVPFSMICFGILWTFITTADGFTLEDVFSLPDVLLTSITVSLFAGFSLVGIWATPFAAFLGGAAAYYMIRKGLCAESIN